MFINFYRAFGFYFILILYSIFYRTLVRNEGVCCQLCAPTRCLSWGLCKVRMRMADADGGWRTADGGRRTADGGRRTTDGQKKNNNLKK